ncbi:hypothetical protein [Candidatus Leptofilum sp.]|uniref:hypothetical protein n=1 Tax=Candidatus Leptofilum sp. TaxID=3241576 RepID=UPI003B5A019A
MELNANQVENLYLSSQEFLKMVESFPFNGTPSEFMANARSIIRDRHIAKVTDRSVRVCFLENLQVIYFYNLGFGTKIHNGKEVFTASYGSIEVVAAPLDRISRYILITDSKIGKIIL